MSATLDRASSALRDLNANVASQSAPSTDFTEDELYESAYAKKQASYPTSKDLCSRPGA